MSVSKDTPTHHPPHSVPVFLAYEPAESAETVARLEHLVAMAREKGWREALGASHADERGFAYVSDVRRAKYLELLPLDSEKDVLEIGASMGQHTVLVAPRVRSVQALEVVPGQAEFAALRCAQEGLTNVRVACGGDDCRLPFDDGSFDGVILNLVFEWCGVRFPEGTEAGQRRMLASIARVLRPGGFLWLATKNRFALRLLMGGRDEHVHGMRFGHALPRWLLKLSLRARGRETGCGALYSYLGLRKLLSEYGFRDVRSYWAAPEMRYPDRYVSTDASSIRAARREGGFRQGDSRLRSALMPWMPAPLVKHVSPGLAFLAYKDGEDVGAAASRT